MHHGKEVPCLSEKTRMIEAGNEQTPAMADRLKSTGTKGFSKAKGFCDDFKKFLNRGNVVDLAVGIIIGTAFGAIVSSLVADIFSPILSLIGGDNTLEECFVVLRSKNHSIQYPTVLKAKEGGAITLNYGRFIQTIINFFLIAFCIFLLLKLIFLVYQKKEVKSTDWPCPKCKEKVKEGAVRCPHCTYEPIYPQMNVTEVET